MDAMMELGIKLSTFDKALSVLYYHVINCVAPDDLQKVLEEKTLLESHILLVLMHNREAELCHDFDTLMWFPNLQYHVAFAQHLASVISDSQQVLKGQLSLKSNTMLFAMYIVPLAQNLQHIFHVNTSKTFMNWSIYIIRLVQAKLFLGNCMIVQGTSSILSFVTHENVSEHLFDLQSSLPTMSSDAKSAHKPLFLSARKSSSAYDGTQFFTCLAYTMILPFLRNRAPLCSISIQWPPASRTFNLSLLTLKRGSFTQAPAPASPQESSPMFESAAIMSLPVCYASPHTCINWDRRNVRASILLCFCFQEILHLIIMFFVILAFCMVMAPLLREMKNAWQILTVGESWTSGHLA